MNERLPARRTTKGTDAAKLRKWGMIFLTAGIVGRSVIQNGLLSLNSISTDELMAAMEADSAVMILSTIAVVFQLMETFAAPLFAFLLVEGFQRTSSFEKYLLRIGGLALVSELPYNLAFTGTLLHLGTRNPVFGLLICLVMLHFFGKFSEKGIKNTAIKIVIFLAAFLWCMMLRIDQGIFLVILVAALWLVRDKDTIRSMACFSASLLCTMFDMFYMGSCLSAIFLHRYNEERGEQNPKLNYCYYPVVLLICGIITKFIG